MLVACQRDATLRVLETHVLSCSAAAPYEVVLADTVLYPEGGGQPPDQGSIAGVRVTDVQRRQGQVIHHTTGPVPLGPARVEVDWVRRRDHMQQHTGQHLLSAVAMDLYGWPTTAFHLAPGVTARCDIELDTAPPDPGALVALEEAVNARIREALPVHHRVVPRDTVPEAVRSRGLPDDVRDVRLVEIDGVDLNTCGGTHVANTAEIQALALLGTERMRGGCRLYFVAGDRVLALLRRRGDRAAELTRLLSTGPEGHTEAVDKLKADAKASRNAARALTTEIAAHLGRQLAATSGPVAVHRRPGSDIPHLNAIAKAALEHRPELLVLLAGDLRSGPFLLAGPPDAVNAAKPHLLEGLQARGGGAPGRVQGKSQHLDRLEEVAATLHTP